MGNVNKIKTLTFIFTNPLSLVTYPPSLSKYSLHCGLIWIFNAVNIKIINKE